MVVYKDVQNEGYISQNVYKGYLKVILERFGILNITMNTKNDNVLYYIIIYYTIS